jgi:flagellin-like hook-associated protein FlgL
VRFVALDHGAAGNNVDFKYEDPGPGNPNTSVAVAGTSVTITLATDADGNVLTTANDVVREVNNFYYTNGSAVVRAELVGYPHGAGVVEPMLEPEPLSGGDDTIDQANHGARIRFEGDGSPLSLGDRFEVDVSHYQGDDKHIAVNANQNYRIDINVTGEEALGEVAADDNIIDILSRLEYALKKHDSSQVADQLPHLNQALDHMTAQMASVGVNLVRNEFTFNILDRTEENSTERLSRIEDVDITKAITDLQTQQTAYQAVLASTSLVTRLSLVDYIR